MRWKILFKGIIIEVFLLLITYLINLSIKINKNIFITFVLFIPSLFIIIVPIYGQGLLWEEIRKKLKERKNGK